MDVLIFDFVFHFYRSYFIVAFKRFVDRRLYEYDRYAHEYDALFAPIDHSPVRQFLHHRGKRRWPLGLVGDLSAIFRFIFLRKMVGARHHLDDDHFFQFWHIRHTHFIGGQAMNTETFIFFLVFSVLLALTYLSIAFLIGALSKNRWQALIGAIAVWFITIVIWPLLMISLLTQLPSYKLVQPTLQVLTILNPAEFIRVFSMMRLGAGSAFGADYDALITWALSNNGLIIFIIMLIIYVFVTLFISSWIWNRGDKYGAD